MEPQQRASAALLVVIFTSMLEMMVTAYQEVQTQRLGVALGYPGSEEKLEAAEVEMNKANEAFETLLLKCRGKVRREEENDG